MIPALFRKIFEIFRGTSKFEFAYSTLSRGDPNYVLQKLKLPQTLTGKDWSKGSVILYLLKAGELGRGSSTELLRLVPKC